MKKCLSFNIPIFTLFVSSTVYAVTWPVPTSKRIGGAYGDYRSPLTNWGFHTGIDIQGS